MIKGQRFFEVKKEGLQASFYGGLKEISDIYGLTYSRLIKEVNREGKTYYAENGVEIKAVLFRVKN